MMSLDTLDTLVSVLFSVMVIRYSLISQLGEHITLFGLGNQQYEQIC